MTTAREDSAFISEVIPAGLLEDALAWIEHNMLIEEVFSQDELETWALDNGFVRKED